MSVAPIGPNGTYSAFENVETVYLIGMQMNSATVAATASLMMH